MMFPSVSLNQAAFVLLYMALIVFQGVLWLRLTAPLVYNDHMTIPARWSMEEELKAMKLPPPSKPGPVDPN